MEIPRDTILPCCIIICFLKIEENADNMFIVRKSWSDAGLKPHRSCWFSDWSPCLVEPGQDASGPRDGGIRSRWIWSISPTQA